jgi:hypothetical protein
MGAERQPRPSITCSLASTVMSTGSQLSLRSRSTRPRAKSRLSSPLLHSEPATHGGASCRGRGAAFLPVRAATFRRSRTCECIPIPVPRTSLILIASCPVRERFLEAIPQQTERKLAGPGRPGTVDGLVAGGALGGAAPCLGRARCLAARGGSINPASKGASQASWRLPPLHPLARFARDWQTSDALRRENTEAWLFEI